MVAGIFSIMLHALRAHIPLLITLLLAHAVALAAMNAQNNLLFWMYGVIMSAVGVSLLLSHLTIRNLSVSRLDPKHGLVGEPLVVQYAVTNRSRFLPAFNVVIEELHRGDSNWPQYTNRARAWVLHIGPGETVHGEAVVWPTARGQVRLDHLRVSTTFPFGLVRRSRRRSQPIHTLIFPRVYTLSDRVLDAVVPSGPAGSRLSSRPGGGDDYFGLREYKPGDSRRQIAWKRSASNQTLIIKERTVPSPPRIRVLLNLTTPTSEIVSDNGAAGLSPRELEERSISLAATFIEAGSRMGYEVGISIPGMNLPVTPLRQSHWHIEKIMGELASIDLDRSRARAPAGLATDTERAGMVVIHPGRIDLSLVRAQAWHFSASQLDHLVVRDARAAAAAVAARVAALRPPSSVSEDAAAAEAAARRSPSFVRPFAELSA
jgi:uncharacterized protein (DUF58 family)